MEKIIKKLTITLMAFLMCFTSGHWMVFADDGIVNITIYDGSEVLDNATVNEGDYYDFQVYYNGDTKYSAGFAISQERAESGSIDYEPLSGNLFNEDINVYVVWQEGYNVTYSIDGEVDQSLTRQNANRFDCFPTVEISKEGYRFSGWFADPEYTEEFDQDKLDGDITLYSYFKKLYKVTYYDDTTELGSRYYCNGDNIQIDPSEFDGFSYPGATLRFDYWWHGNSEEPYTGELTEDIAVFLSLYEPITVTYCDQYGNPLETKSDVNPRLWNYSPEEISGFYLDADAVFKGWGRYQGSKEVFTGYAESGMCLYAIIDYVYLVRFYNDDESYIDERRITGDIADYHISNLLSDWQRDGYRFCGWSTMPGEENQYPISGTLTNGTPVYAIYKKEYTVNYFLEENVPLESHVYVNGENYQKDISEFSGYTPREDGKVFYYWSETPAGEKCTATLERDMDLYAVFGDPVTINYHFEDGSIMGSLITTPDKALTINTGDFGVYDVGGEFGGWSSDPYGKTVYDGEITNNLDLYRIVYRYYNVTYYIDGAAQDTRNVREDRYNESITSFMGFEYETRIFLHWSLKPDGEAFNGYLAGDCTLYAVLINGVRVNYWDFYGSKILETKIIENNEWNIDPSEVEGLNLDENQVFLGWTEWGPEQRSSNAIFTGDVYDGIKLYPIITEQHSVSFYDENGTPIITKYLTGETNIESIHITEFGSQYEKDGYAFIGWTTELGKDERFYGPPEDGLELYAYYDVGYKVTYCLDDDTVLLTRNQPYNTWDYKIDISKIYNVPQDYYFMHWSLEKGGEEYNGYLSEDTTLYAVITDGFNVYYYDEEGNYLGTRKTGKDNWWVDAAYFSGYNQPDNSSFDSWTLEKGSKKPYYGNAYEGMEVYANNTYYYYVTYYDGDNIVGQMTVADNGYRNDITNFPDYVEDGRHFLWWSASKDSTEMFDGYLTEDTELYAVFGTGSIVYYNRMDGSYLGRKGIFGDAKEWDISPYEFDNYALDDNKAFLGWSENPESYTLYEGSVYDGLTLYAVEGTLFDVRYYDGEKLLGTEKVMEGRDVSHKAITDFANYEANGRFFKYWTQYPETEEQYTDGYVYSDLILYAVYGTAYDVTYYDGNTVLGTEKVGEGDYIGDKLITDFADYNADGRIFKYWSNNPESEEQYTGYVYSNMSLYAVFEKQYNVSYYDGDTLLGTSLVTSFSWNKNIEEIDPAYEKPGYRFAGWTATKGGHSPGYYDDSLYDGLILYAVYKKTYTVEYNYNGEVIYTNNQATENEYYYYPYDIQLPQGYSFAYWTLDLNTKKEFNGPITGDTVLYAVIGKTNPVISLNVNGGNLYNHPGDLTLSSCNGIWEFSINENYRPEKAGYTFIGWSRSATKYDSDLNYFLEDTTLYAYYTHDGYASFNVNFQNINGDDTTGLIYEIVGLDQEVLAGEEVTATIKITDADYYINSITVLDNDYVFTPVNEEDYLERTISFATKEGLNYVNVYVGKGNLNIRFITGDNPNDYVDITTDRYGNIDNIPEPEKPGYFLAGWSDSRWDYYNGIDKSAIRDGSVFYPIWQEAGKTCNVDIMFVHSVNHEEREFNPDFITLTKDGSGISGEWYSFDIAVANKACGLRMVLLDENGNEIECAVKGELLMNDRYSRSFQNETVHVEIRVPDMEGITVKLEVIDQFELYVFDYNSDLISGSIDTISAYYGERLVLAPYLANGYDFDRNNPLEKAGPESLGVMSSDGEIFVDGKINTNLVDLSVPGQISWNAGWGYGGVGINLIYVGTGSAREQEFNEDLIVTSDNYGKPGIMLYNPGDDTATYIIKLYSKSNWGEETVFDGNVDLYKTVKKADGTVTSALLSGIDPENLEIDVEPGDSISLAFDTEADVFKYKVFERYIWGGEEEKTWGYINKNDEKKHLVVYDEPEIISIMFWDSENSREQTRLDVEMYENTYAIIRTTPFVTNDIIRATFTSSNESVVKVDGENQMIFPVGTGTATITATYLGVTTSMIVNVNASTSGNIINFDVNGGNPLPSTKSQFDSSETYRDNWLHMIEPVREGYIFLGWTKNRDAFPLTKELGDRVEANVTLYAYWLPEDKTIVKLKNNFYVDDGNNLVNCTVNGEGTYNTGDRVTVDFEVNDTNYYIYYATIYNDKFFWESVTCNTGESYGDSFTHTFTAPGGLVYISPNLYRGNREVTFVTDEDNGQTVVKQTDRYGFLPEAEWPVITRPGYYLKGWGNKDSSTPTIGWHDGDWLQFDTTVYPMWEEAGKECVVSVSFTEGFDVSGITVEGEGTYLSGHEITLTLNIDENTFVGLYGTPNVVRDGSLEYVKGLDNTVFDKVYHDESVSFTFTVPAEDAIDIRIDVDNALEFEIDNPCPEILTVKRRNRAKTGDRITIVFDVADGYALSSEEQFMRGMPSGGGGYIAMNGEFFAPNNSYKVNEEVVDVSVPNQLSWIAGCGSVGRWANIVYVGKNTADEQKLSGVISVTNNNNYDSAGLAFYNPTGDTTSYTINLSESDAAGSRDKDLINGQNNSAVTNTAVTPKKLMLTKANSVNRLTSRSTGLGNVTILITKGNADDPSNVQTETRTVNDLSSFDVEVEPGQFVTYSLLDEDGDRYFGYKYSVNDPNSGKQISNGYVNEDDKIKHLTVADGPEVEDIYFVNFDGNIEVGKTYTLKPTFIPSDVIADKVKLSYMSEDTSVASVDRNGVITGISVGRTTIIVTAENGKTWTLYINVYEKRTVTLDYNGGTGSKNNKVRVDTDFNTYNINPQQIPKRDGYVFCGWTLEKDKRPFVDWLQVDEDITVYAYWLEDTIAIIELDENNGHQDKLRYTGIGTFTAGEQHTITIEVTDSNYYISGVSFDGSFREEEFPTVEFEYTFELKPGIAQIGRHIMEGYHTITFVNDDGTSVEKTADRYDRVYDIPEPTKEGYYLLGWSDGQELNYTFDEDYIWAQESNLTVYPIWEEVGNECVIEYQITREDGSIVENPRIEVTGAGTYQSGEEVTLNIRKLDDIAVMVSYDVFDDDNNSVLIKNGYGRRSRIINEDISYTFIAPDKDHIIVDICYTDDFRIEFRSIYPESVIKVPEQYTCLYGEDVVLEFESADGYIIDPTLPFIGDGFGTIGYNSGFGDVFVTTPYGVQINQDIIDTSVTNRVSFRAGLGWFSGVPYIIYVGTDSEEERELGDLLSITNEDDYKAPGIAIYNSTGEDKDYTVDLSVPGKLSNDISMETSGAIFFRRMSAINVGEADAVNGIGNVILYVTRGTIGDEENADRYTVSANDLSKLNLTVDAGEFMTVSINDEEDFRYDKYQYDLIDNSSSEIKTGYVNENDTKKHLIYNKETEAAPEFSGHSMVLSGQIGVDFGIKLPD
ncbi:MAG: hypothetical protein E7187_05405, partial [Erysipelotrichaceae bacterium]|nr:hypothetical protein [Erysipelotrichaceae bacterium]